MRIPIAVDLESRDGAVDQDAKILNGIVEQRGEEFDVRTRPGSNDLGLLNAGTAQLLAYFNEHVIAISNNEIYRTPVAVSGTLINDMGTLTVTITRSGSTATASTSPTRHVLQTGDSVTISGANQAEYNGTFTVIVSHSLSFTYTVTGTPATPATGTITAVSNSARIWDAADNGLVTGSTGFLLVKNRCGGSRRIRSDWNSAQVIDTDSPLDGASAVVRTARGVEFMDGYFFVMTLAGVIYNNTLDTDPGGANWVATDFVTAEKENGAGVCLSRTLDYIVALKEYSTELFYNAGNATGSPLSPVDNGFSLIGCASADSVAKLEGALCWIAQTRQKGRSVYMMHGLEQSRVSTPDIDRILDADDLATVYAYGVKIGGHSLYVLTLVTSNITLVYDATSDKWAQWSSLTAGSAKSVSSITRSGTTATINFAVPHTLNDGDPVLIAGADQADYNGIFQVSYVDSDTVTIEVENSPTTPATGTITGTPYTESYFKFTRYVNAGGRDVVMHESDGHLYEILASETSDEAAPINLFARTTRLDGGSTGRKKLGFIRVIGDTVDSTVMVRHSDDDCSTFSAYRRVDMNTEEPELRRCGAFKRRTIEIRHIGDAPLRLKALELGVSQ